MSYANPDTTFFSEVAGNPVAVISPSTGTTVRVPSGARKVYINNAGVLAALTVLLPGAVPSMDVQISSKSGVTALTLKDYNAATFAGSPTALTAGVPVSVVALTLQPGALPVWIRWS